MNVKAAPAEPLAQGTHGQKSQTAAGALHEAVREYGLPRSRFSGHALLHEQVIRQVLAGSVDAPVSSQPHSGNAASPVPCGGSAGR